MRGGHCLGVWTEKQKLVTSSTAKSELCAAVKTASSDGLGVRSVAKDLGVACGLKPHLDATATMCQVNRRGLGTAKTCGRAELVVTKVGTNANPADLMTKPPLGPKIVQLTNTMRYEFVEQSSRQEESSGVRLVGGLTDVKEKAKGLAAATAK